MRLRSLAVTALALILAYAAADRPVPAQTPVAADRAAIDELALINRMLASQEMGVLGAYGHVSVRNRHEPSHYFSPASSRPA